MNSQAVALTLSITSVQLLPPNLKRRTLTIQNIASHPVFLSLGSPAAAGQGEPCWVGLRPLAWTLDDHGQALQDALYAVAQGGIARVLVVEGFEDN